MINYYQKEVPADRDVKTGAFDGNANVWKKL